MLKSGKNHYFYIIRVLLVAFTTNFIVFFSFTQAMEWNACIICGSAEGELKCPAERLREGVSSGEATDSYESFIKNVAEFREKDKLPVDVKIPVTTT